MSYRKSQTLLWLVAVKAQRKTFSAKLTLNFGKPTPTTRYREHAEAHKNRERMFAESNPDRTNSADWVALDWVKSILLSLCCWEEKIKCL